MTEAELARIEAEAQSRFKLHGLPHRASRRRVEARRQHRARHRRVAASPGRIRGRRIPHGLSEDARAVLEKGSAVSGVARWVEARESDEDAAAAWQILKE